MCLSPRWALPPSTTSESVDFAFLPNGFDPATPPMPFVVIDQGKALLFGKVLLPCVLIDQGEGAELAFVALFGSVVGRGASERATIKVDACDDQRQGPREAHRGGRDTVALERLRASEARLPMLTYAYVAMRTRLPIVPSNSDQGSYQLCESSVHMLGRAHAWLALLPEQPGGRCVADTVAGDQRDVFDGRLLCTSVCWLLSLIHI